ncbi:hypothetical protein B0H19DRAFT_1263603 [Mycena capillaripes]|nr:hypothetical protein B0H19DRAFT_1263603 [Mycena capillaripes]
MQLGVGNKNPLAVIQHRQRATIRLKELAASNYVSLVRSWTFNLKARLTPYRQVARTYSEVIHIFSTTLGVYQNVRSLTLHGLAVDASLRAAILSLTMLRELNLTDSIILARAGTLLDIHTFSLSVSEQATDPIQHLHLVSPATLCTLTLDGSHEAVAFLTALLHYGACNLEHLTIQLSDLVLAPLLNFLEHCPQLVRIEVQSASALSVPLRDRLPSSVIPNLFSFVGPHTIAGPFTLVRPVVNVELIGARAMQGVSSHSIECLSQSSAALRSLSIDVPAAIAHEYARIVAARFPGLEELSLALVVFDHAEDEAIRATAAGFQAVSVLSVTDHPFCEFIERLCAGDVLFPAGLVVLSVKAPWKQRESLPFPMAQQCAIVSALACRGQPALSKVLFGDSDGTWTRRGALWTEWQTGKQIGGRDTDTRLP